MYSAPKLVELLYEEIKGSSEYTDSEGDREAWLDAQEHFYCNFAGGCVGDNAPLIIDANGK